MWEMYDELINQVPPDIKILDMVQTKRRIYVQSEYGIGTAMTFSEKKLNKKQYIGGTISQIAPLLKSWEFNLASLALASINSFYNSEKQLNNQKVPLNMNHDIFMDYKDSTNKKIATVGAFYYLKRYPELEKAVKVLEIKDVPGTYPASACEYLLPEMEVVFITGSTIVNKTLPRLLELSKNSQVILVGGSTPLNSILYKYGVSIIAGKRVTALPKATDSSKILGNSIILKQSEER